MSYLTVQPRFGHVQKPGIQKPAKPEERGGPADSPPSAQNGIWVATERIPAKMGGLGEVSKTIPETIANLMPSKDLRIIVPYLTPHAKWDENNPDKRFQKTGVSMRLTCHDGVEREFTVLQKFEPAPGQTKNGNWVYAIRNDELFRATLKDPKTGAELDAGLQKYTYNPKAGEYEKVMMFNRAAAKLIPLLDGKNTEFPGSRLHRFGDETSVNKDRRQIDFVMAHDWLTGPVLYELPNEVTRRKIFMFHNKYDKIQVPKVAKDIGMETPGNLYDKEDLYSPLHLGLASADAIIGEHNFVQSILNTPLSKGEQYVKVLRERYEQHQRHFNAPGQYKPVIYDMHHGLAADFTPLGKNDPDTLHAPNALNESRETWIKKLCQAKEKELKAKGASASEIQEAVKTLRSGKETAVKPFRFEPLKSTSVEDIRRFKTANKLALQRKLGLEEDKDAIIMGWAARLEPRQKGFFLVQYCMEKLLAENELKAQGKMPGKKVQFIIYGDTQDPELKEWLNAKNARYGTEKGKKWVFMPNRFADHVAIKQLSAGGDFTILPSIYEPYGLTQLEAMKMCSIPIVHGVDGLRSSVTDNPDTLPQVYKKDFEDGKPNPKTREKVWNYPQNGFLMEPLDWKYMDYIDRRQEAESVLSLIKAVDHPEGAAAKLSYGDRLKNLSDRLEDAIGSRKSKRATLKKELAKEDPTKPEAVSKKTQTEKLERQILEITRHQRTLDDGKLTPEVREALTKIFELSPQEQKVNETESGKLLSAIHRALRVAEKKPAELLQIRRNGMDYVEKEHNWNGIVSRRYRPVIEDESNTPRPDIARAARRKPLNPFPVDTWDDPKNWQPVNPTSSSPKTRIASVWSDIWSFPSQFMTLLLKIFGLRMD